jgi:hypothetical protein
VCDKKSSKTVLVREGILQLSHHAVIHEDEILEEQIEKNVTK